MNIAIRHYREKLELEIQRFELAYGDIEQTVMNEYAMDLHTMQVEGKQQKQDVINEFMLSANVSKDFDDPDLVSLQNYERKLDYHNGATN